MPDSGSGSEALLGPGSRMADLARRAGVLSPARRNMGREGWSARRARITFER